ncbi:hypothetical protein C5167_006556 [Papaver somniferum]|uniref:Uncharacterized protein n=1 Tax=Papaver somniferum TaxID=3469 RepID=A0A4Y7JEL3_PAPSO|nr:hypothetical protein C5167_006556 [Papaver somniferum]
MVVNLIISSCSSSSGRSQQLKLQFIFSSGFVLLNRIMFYGCYPMFFLLKLPQEALRVLDIIVRQLAAECWEVVRPCQFEKHAVDTNEHPANLGLINFFSCVSWFSTFRSVFLGNLSDTNRPVSTFLQCNAKAIGSGSEGAESIRINVILENACSEQRARMSAMDSTSRNDEDMLDHVTLTYNREHNVRKSAKEMHTTGTGNTTIYPLATTKSIGAGFPLSGQLITVAQVSISSFDNVHGMVHHYEVGISSSSSSKFMILLFNQ